MLNLVHVSSPFQEKGGERSKPLKNISCRDKTSAEFSTLEVAICAYYPVTLFCNETAQLKDEKLTQATFGTSPVRY